MTRPKFSLAALFVVVTAAGVLAGTARVVPISELRAIDPIFLSGAAMVAFVTATAFVGVWLFNQ